MTQKNCRITATGLFALVLCYLLGGLFLHGRGALSAVLFSCLFSACICATADALCKAHFSSAEFFGAHRLLRHACALPTAFCAAASFAGFARAASPFFPALPALLLALLLCVCALLRGFAVAARFAGLCAFPMLALFLLSFVSGGGEITLTFGENELFAAIDAIGAVPVFFSLYLRCVTAESEKMSDFAKNSIFQPSPLLCGVCACLFAGAFYLFLCRFCGENIIFSLLSWFIILARMLAILLAACDLAAVPEACKSGGAHALMPFAAMLAAAQLCTLYLPPHAVHTALAFCNVILPCALFAFGLLAKSFRRPR